VNLRELTKQALQSQGFEGLYHTEYACGCGLDDLMPCDEPHPVFCAPAHSIECNPDKPCQHCEYDEPAVGQVCYGPRGSE
jgi:hypothetical protein